MQARSMMLDFSEPISDYEQKWVKNVDAEKIAVCGVRRWSESILKG